MDNNNLSPSNNNNLLEKSSHEASLDNITQKLKRIFDYYCLFRNHLNTILINLLNFKNLQMTLVF